ncbi:MAG: energy transducer TonB [Ignavibacteriae bacterium]|nr:energy transducer TonB [Ignavibacteriota bacterium]
MKYITVILLMLFLLLTGCSMQSQMGVPPEQPELISMVSLPTLTSTTYAEGLKFDVLMHVLRDGSVEYVRMIGSSGDPEWDAQALESIKQWRFAAPRRDGEPIDVWFRQLIIVQVQEPVFMNIGQLVSSSLQEADSLYALIQEGNDLDELFKKTSTPVNILQFPKRVREEIRKLYEGKTSRPIRVGETYVIYKRFPADVTKNPAL